GGAPVGGEGRARGGSAGAQGTSAGASLLPASQQLSTPAVLRAHHVASPPATYALSARAGHFQSGSPQQAPLPSSRTAQPRSPNIASERAEGTGPAFALYFSSAAPRNCFQHERLPRAPEAQPLSMPTATETAPARPSTTCAGPP